VVAISGVDTRALTQHIRKHGAMGSCITTDLSQQEEALRLAKIMPSLSGVDLAKVVSRQTIERWHAGQGDWALDSMPERLHVVVYDFGVKHTILRILHDKGCHLTLVPAQTSAEEVLSLNPDGVLLSNGPGDPAACDYAISATKKLIEASIPLFGICLGFQILGLASGARTLKMKFGHHGVNHPVIEVNGSNRVLITSQNHGFVVDETSLPREFLVTHRSLFDQTLQGIMHHEKPIFGFQGHPEASPGPHEASCLFDKFIRNCSPLLGRSFRT
jgi:carbamoyl-phosphate synthase small subunit